MGASVPSGATDPRVLVLGGGPVCRGWPGAPAVISTAWMPKSGQRYERDFLSRSPLLGEWQVFARTLINRPGWPTLDEYSEFVDAERRARAGELEPVRFVAAPAPRRRGRVRPALDLAELYDGRIALRRQVPCLDASYHDLFNALVWAAFPRSKRALHARQFRALQCRWRPGATRLPNRRTPEQDALTIFDEGGVVVLGAPEHGLGAALDQASLRVVPFGHAVMEHVCFEAAPVRAAVLLLDVHGVGASGRELFEAVDRALAPRLADEAQLSAPEFDGVLSILPPRQWSFAREPGRPQSATRESPRAEP